MSIQQVTVLMAFEPYFGVLVKMPLKSDAFSLGHSQAKRKLLKFVTH